MVIIWGDIMSGFALILKYMGIGQCKYELINNRTVLTYNWNGFKFSLLEEDEDNTYVIVDGKIPFELAEVLKEKYGDDNYGITSINSGIYSGLIDDKYVEKIDNLQFSYSNREEYESEVNLARQQLEKRDNSYKYIKSYCINTNLGLIAFIAEIKDYQAKKKGNSGVWVAIIEDILKQINLDLLKDEDFKVSIDDWMSGMLVHGNTYFQLMSNGNKNGAVSYLREYLEKFDMAVIPFVDAEEEELENLSENVSINIKKSSSKYRVSGLGCIDVKIIDKHNKNTVCFYRNDDGYGYAVQINTGNSRVKLVDHVYDVNSGEGLRITYQDGTVSCYDILKVPTGLSNNRKISDISVDEMNEIVNTLNDIIGYVEDVTINNMKSQCDGVIKTRIPTSSANNDNK